MSRSPLIQMQSIHYAYGNKEVLKGIDFNLYPGEVHALTGDHGSGKTSLVKLLSGSLVCQSGSINVKGQNVSSLNLSLANQMGIGMLYQNAEILMTGTLLDNIYLGRYPLFMFPHKKRRMIRECEDLFRLYGFDEEPLSHVIDLTPDRRQILSFLRVLSKEPDILILDEISHKTTPEQQDHIYKLLGKCRSRGMGIIYVTSNIDEIFQIADRVTVLQDGHRRGTEDVSRVDRTRLVNLAFSFAMDREESGTPENHKVLLISRYDKRIINDIPQGLMIISPDNKIQDINLAAARILGCEDSSIQNMDLAEYLGNSSIEKNDDILFSVIERKSYLWKKLSFAHNKLLKIRVSPLGDEKDSDQGILIFLEDVSSDYETRDYLQQVEKFVSTAELAAGVAHEVNNPLGIIQNYLDLLQLEKLNDNSKEYVQTIQSELTRIVEIINSLLSFSRAGVRPLSVLSIHDLLDEVFILIKHKFQKRKINYSKSLYEKSLFIVGHENKMKQLLLNLLNNAIEAVLDEGEVSISTDVLLNGNDGEFVKICVKDNGYGIPEEAQEQIFSPFFSTKMTKTNTGLGLSICQHIVESYGGKISVLSTPGKSTAFSILLPLFDGKA